jgi:hypothetical protein
MTLRESGNGELPASRVPLAETDLKATTELNAQHGVEFDLHKQQLPREWKEE